MSDRISDLGVHSTLSGRHPASADSNPSTEPATRAALFIVYEGMKWEGIEEGVFSAVMESTDGDLARAAHLLGKSVRTLQRKRRKEKVQSPTPAGLGSTTKPEETAVLFVVHEGMSWEEIESGLIDAAVERMKGNVTHAARLIGRSVRTLQRKRHVAKLRGAVSVAETAGRT